jgi:hypothetical protein
MTVGDLRRRLEDPEIPDDLPVVTRHDYKDFGDERFNDVYIMEVCSALQSQVGGLYADPGRRPAPDAERFRVFYIA